MVSVLSTVERSGWVHPRLAAEIVTMALGSGPRYEMSYVPMIGVSPVSAARNRVVEQHFLPSGADWLCMFDNDIGPPNNVVEVVLSAPPEADIVILPYWIWCAEQRPVLCFGDLQVVDGVPQMDPKPYASPGWQEGGAGGTGAIFIRRRVFSLLNKPFFRFTADENQEIVVGEDIYFTSCAKQSGARIFTNLNYYCTHYHTVDLAALNLGVNAIIQRYVTQLNERLSEAGIDVPDLNTILKT
jgi:hypothetical protein